MAEYEVSRLSFNGDTYEIADELARQSVGTARSEIAEEAARLDAVDTGLAGRITNLETSAGAVLVAKTKAARTDTSKIYVYTGNESGATAGHWYYHNGTAWTDGGVYSQNLDAIDAAPSSSSDNAHAAGAKYTYDSITSLNTDLGKLRQSVSDDYSSGSTYAVGDYCMHDGELYKCTTAISVSEDWTSAHWTKVDTMVELNNLKNALQGYTEILDIDDYIYSIGGYMVTSSGGFGIDGDISYRRNYFTIIGNIAVDKGDKIYLKSNKFSMRIAVVSLSFEGTFTSPRLTRLEYKDFDSSCYYEVKNKGYLRFSLRLVGNPPASPDPIYTFTADEVKEELVIERNLKSSFYTYYDSAINGKYGKYIKADSSLNITNYYSSSKYYRMSDYIEVSEDSIYRVVFPLLGQKSEYSSIGSQFSNSLILFFDENKNLLGGQNGYQTSDVVSRYHNVVGDAFIYDVIPYKKSKYMIVQWRNVLGYTINGQTTYNYQMFEDIKILGTGIPKEYPKEPGFDCYANFHNSADGIQQFLEVADSYYNRTIEVNGETKYMLEYTTILRSRIASEGKNASRVLNITSTLNRYTGGIDCSAFVGMVLRGIKFDNTYYYGHAAGDYLGDDVYDVTIVVDSDGDLSDEFTTEEISFEQFLNRNTSYEWSISTHDYYINYDPILCRMFKDYAESHSDHKVQTAADICYFYESSGNKVYLDEKLTNIDVGDILFFTRYSSSGFTADDKMWVQPGRYKHINHVAIVYDKIKAELDSNGNPIYDSAGKRIIDENTSQSIITGNLFENTGEPWPIDDYPYIYVIIEVTGTSGACQKRILKKTDSTTSNDIQTISSVCRPFLNTSSRVKFGTPDNQTDYNTGTILVDNNYLYVKTRNGMKKIALSSI